MTIQIKENPSKTLVKEFVVTIPHRDIASKVQAELMRRAQTARIAGFRPGKVPVEVIEQRQGNEIVSAVLETLMSESNQKLITDNKLTPALRPCSHPEAAYKKGEDFSYIVHVEILPKIEEVDFKSLEIIQYKIKKDPKKLEHLNQLRAKAAGLNEPIKTKRKTQLGDIVSIDFDGKIDGKPLKGGKAENYELELGAQQFIPGFEEGLLGYDTGKKLTLNLAFPKDYHEKTIAGKKVVFDVTIHEIMERIPAAIDDELAKKHGFENLKAMEVANQKILEDSHVRMEHGQSKQEVLNKLASIYSFDVPPGMVDMELDSIFQQVAREEGLHEPTEADFKRWREEYKKIAERRVRLGLVLADVGKRHNIQVAQKELTDLMLQEAQRYPGQENKVVDYYRQNPGAVNHLRAQILEEKTIDFILKTVKIKKKEVSEEEFQKVSEAAEVL
ncbi:MAG: trigger factor [Alphaproteobacteria bacterium RIFCSPHIGHO2_01_FULL_41_14]|nr:MAG: trigger factor [Alphaproteobacteria bacterium GWA1_45_9]OFW90006.1 MAG: trigger factor [Alphaproteobacteria bacterium RIFCSPHIGHO2_01_FULL_41_14]HCI48799.1 trigger factor [Holosporales bacterium]